VPRPFGYFRIDLPEHSYISSGISCPFEFKYARESLLLKKDTSLCWYNIYYPRLKATIYLTYIPVNNDLNVHIDETQQLTYEHQVKATKIDRLPIAIKESRVFGLMYKLKGDVASATQFYVTDSTHHYLRGSLYFNATVNTDSILPVLNYINQDIDTLIHSLKWMP
jgi:gliding motility-associated lipoprotein GldD